jgi:predicted small secreted protein
MSHKLNLFIGVLALLSLPVLSACNTGGAGTAGVNQDMQAAGEGRGTGDAIPLIRRDSVGEEGISGEDTSGPIQEEDVGLPRGAIGAAEDEQGAPDAATMGTGGTGDAAQ